MADCFGDGPFIYKLNDNGTGPPLLIQVFIERGWKEFNIEFGECWNLWWKTSGFPIGHHNNLANWQYINHIPKGSSICRKDNLVRYIRCMRKIYGSIYDFIPPGYNLPLEYSKLAAECNKNRTGNVNEDDDTLYCEGPVWICKPVAQSQGRGIFLFRKLSELHYDTNTIVQRYIEKPLLIGGYKFDLRLYVCIPSYHPLTIYLYKEGLARFGTDKFSLNDLRNPFRHLTNSSINKLGPGYSEMKERIGSGCKWTLRQLRRYFHQMHIKDWLMWQRIACIVILTLLSYVTQVPPTFNCFEFFGFDILIDDALKPWLLEVNLSPALANDCDVDRSVKKPMLHDLFDLLGFPMYNTGLSVFNIWLDDCKENTETNVNTNNGLHLPVITAVGRWRRKQRKSACLRPMSSNNRPRSASLNNYRMQKERNIERSRKFQCHEWGNDKNWSLAPSQEGGWIRLCPFNVETVSFDNKSHVKTIVYQVMKWNKLAKDLFRNHPLASECQLNEFLMKELDMNGEVWIPPL